MIKTHHQFTEAVDARSVGDCRVLSRPASGINGPDNQELYGPNVSKDPSGLVGGITHLGGI